MKRTTPLKRSGLIKPVGNRGRRMQSAEREAVARIREVSECQMAGEFGLTCDHIREDHHVEGRDETLWGNDENHMRLCRTHHRYATENSKTFKARVNEIWPGRIDRLRAIKWGLEC